jgi:hypothetical protein
LTTSSWEISLEEEGRRVKCREYGPASELWREFKSFDRNLNKFLPMHPSFWIISRVRTAGRAWVLGKCWQIEIQHYCTRT